MSASGPSAGPSPGLPAERPWTRGPRPLPGSWRGWVPDVALALVVAALGVVEVVRLPLVVEVEPGGAAVVVAATAVACALARHLPGAALAVVWVLFLAQGLLGLPVLLVQAAVAVVAFGTARWGSRATVLGAALSLPLAGAVLVALVGAGRLDTAFLRGIGDGGSALAYAFYDRVGASWPLALLGILSTLLVLPWLAGTALRLAERARASRVSQVAAEEDAERAHRETAQAQEIARLTEDRARMARDVHDVVGHSLAVILAQAESAQFLEGEERLQETLATIATSARSSLQDVRRVLAGPAPGAAVVADETLALVEGVRGSGVEVEHREVGTPRPLPPELATVAHRVLQEMLTNAMRHGRRDAVVQVERHWPDGGWSDELRIEVRNLVADPPEALGPDGALRASALGSAHPGLRPGGSTGPAPDGSGRGIDGMRRRLHAVGGRLDVRTRDEEDGVSCTATAWVPVRAGAHAPAWEGSA